MSCDNKNKDGEGYLLDRQIGFVLRQVSQRHASIFMANMLPDLTPTRFAALAKLYEKGSLTQNELGRQTAMDASTIKGVVDNLCQLGFTLTTPDAKDKRRHVVSLTQAGTDTVVRALPIAHKITALTLDNLGVQERETVLRLLRKMV